MNAKIQPFTYNSIHSFVNVYAQVKHVSTYIGNDENDNPMYDNTKTLPTITYESTIKVDGTNGGIILDFRTNELFICSKENILTIENDNYDFAKFITPLKDVLLEKLSYLKQYGDVIVVYGEYFGRSIGKTQFNKLENRYFVMFDIAVIIDATLVEDFNSVHNKKYLSSDVVKTLPMLEDDNILNIYYFDTKIYSIDFNSPKSTLDEINSDMQESIKNSTLAKYFNIEKFNGEGIVLKPVDSNIPKINFKVKGEKHKVTNNKVKNVIPMDIEVVNSINEFIEYAVTENRLAQGYNILIGKYNVLSMEQLSEYLKWVSEDVKKEESDTLVNNNLTYSQISNVLINKAKIYYIKQINSIYE